MTDFCIKLSKDKPIAVICGGKYDNKHVSIVAKEESEDDDYDRDPFEQLDIEEFIEKFRFLPIEERLTLVNEIKNGKQNKLTNRFKESCKTSMKIDSGKFLIYPTQKTERIFIAGKSEMGKSSLASMYINEYSNMFPDRKIILLSIHIGEKAYEPHNITQIELNDEFIENPPTLDELANSLVIFDDADNMMNPKIAKTVKAVNDNLIANGRKYNIHVLTLAHQLMDYSKTRNILNEANRVVYFQVGSKYHTQRYLKVYAGFDKDQTKKLNSLKSRWVCIGFGMPNYYISENECGILQ